MLNYTVFIICSDFRNAFFQRFSFQQNDLNSHSSVAAIIIITKNAPCHSCGDVTTDAFVHLTFIQIDSLNGQHIFMGAVVNNVDVVKCAQMLVFRPDS